jgi:DnaJ-class molecular chaperone
MNEPRDNKGNIKCSYCGGYTYKFDHGASGQHRCPACNGTGISQKPSKPKAVKAESDDELELP